MDYTKTVENFKTALKLRDFSYINAEDCRLAIELLEKEMESEKRVEIGN